MNLQVLVTSRQTGFSVKYLYQMSLDILYLHATFSGKAKKFIAYHLGSYSDKKLDQAKDDGERLASIFIKSEEVITTKNVCT